MNRLPGPRTMSSASAMAASASSEARDVGRRDPDPLDAGRGRDPRLAVDDGPVPPAGMEGQRRRRAGSDLAADGEDPVHLADAFLEVAALDRGHRRDQQVADRMAAEGPPVAAPSSVAPGKRYWSSSLMSGSASARAAMQLPDVADRRDAELLAQHAGRAAVVGDRDDRRQVARVLLQAAQERRQAGPAADRDDPRAAGEEPLLVDDLDERLVTLAGRNGSVRRPDELPRPEQEQPDAGAARISPAEGVRQELEGDDVDDGCSGPPGSTSAVSLAEDVGAGQGEQELADEDDEQPALDAHPGSWSQPRRSHARSSSRWNTADGPRSRSRSHAASSSAMTIERW